MRYAPLNIDDSDDDLPKMPPPLPQPMPDFWSQYKTGDFVVAKIFPLPTKSKKPPVPLFYVGQLMGENYNNMVEINCMRRYRSKTREFVFPPRPDIHPFSKDDVVKLLLPPKVVHLVHYFGDEFAPYGPRLR
jgi:hypothetical protein